MDKETRLYYEEYLKNILDAITHLKPEEQHHFLGLLHGGLAGFNEMILDYTTRQIAMTQIQVELHSKNPN